MTSPVNRGKRFARCMQRIQEGFGKARRSGKVLGALNDEHGQVEFTSEKLWVKR
jgi:hypothetical protein